MRTFVDHSKRWWKWKIILNYIWRGCQSRSKLIIAEIRIPIEKCRFGIQWKGIWNQVYEMQIQNKIEKWKQNLVNNLVERQQFESK